VNRERARKDEKLKKELAEMMDPEIQAKKARDGIIAQYKQLPEEYQRQTLARLAELQRSNG